MTNDVVQSVYLIIVLVFTISLFLLDKNRRRKKCNRESICLNYKRIQYSLCYANRTISITEQQVISGSICTVNSKCGLFQMTKTGVVSKQRNKHKIKNNVQMKKIEPYNIMNDAV